jgi:hypothetical protein
MRLAIYLACALSLSACADALPDESTPMQEPDWSGSLRIPLLAEVGAGETYRLRGVEFEVSGTAMLSMSERDGLRARESLVTRLPAGEYIVYLRPGWRLMRRDASGKEVEAKAELLSENPVRLTVQTLGDENLQLAIRTGDKELRFGASGGVRVTSAEQTLRPGSF